MSATEQAAGQAMHSSSAGCSEHSHVSNHDKTYASHGDGCCQAFCGVAIVDLRGTSDAPMAQQHEVAMLPDLQVLAFATRLERPPNA